jgi:acid phosphatase class B
MFKYYFAFYAVAIVFALLVNANADLVTSAFANAGISAEQLSEAAQAISTLN